MMVGTAFGWLFVGVLVVPPMLWFSKFGSKIVESKYGLHFPLTRKTERYIVGIALYLLLYVPGIFLIGFPNPLTQGSRIQRDLTALKDLIFSRGQGIQVGVDEFTFGLLGNPALEFAIHVVAMTVVLYLVLRRTRLIERDMKEISLPGWVFWGSIGSGAVSFFILDTLGIQVFPLTGLLGFVALVFHRLTIHVALTAFLIWIPFGFAHIFIDWTRPEEIPLVNRPSWKNTFTAGVYLFLAVPIMASGFSGVLWWISLMAFVMVYRRRNGRFNPLGEPQ